MTSHLKCRNNADSVLGAKLLENWVKMHENQGEIVFYLSK